MNQFQFQNTHEDGPKREFYSIGTPSSELMTNFLHHKIFMLKGFIIVSHTAQSKRFRHMRRIRRIKHVKFIQEERF